VVILAASGWGWSVILGHFALIFRKVIMIKSLAAAVLAMGLLALPACNTTAGVGKDVQVVGGAIENAAIKQKK
tara:strand:- start:10626 stop:10844 length:219 start_codon:yes stop_codon:yes gene_type:complete